MFFGGHFRFRMKNLLGNFRSQNNSNLCGPFSATFLIVHAMWNDLYWRDQTFFFHSFDNILLILIMIVYPRSMAGLNLNPKENEIYFQTNEMEILLKRICSKTYLLESGWEIIRKMKHRCHIIAELRNLPDKENFKIPESTCKYEKGSMRIKIFRLKIL